MNNLTTTPAAVPAAPGQLLLRNRRAQPVELHLPGGVLVLPPLGQALVNAACIELPQLAWLLARKAVDASTASPDDALACDAQDAALGSGAEAAAGTAGAANRNALDQGASGADANANGSSPPAMAGTPGAPRAAAAPAPAPAPEPPARSPAAAQRRVTKT